MNTRNRRHPGLPSTETRGPLLFAAILSFACFGGFGAWSALAPLESAALAPGTVVVESSRKTVAHLEGGVVADILVREHDRVEAGQVLVRLDPTLARAALDLYRGDLIAAESLIARLTSEREGADRIAFPAWLLEDRDPRAREAMNAERHVFEARREQLEGQTKILQQKVAQLDEQIRGLYAQIAAQDTQLRLIAEEIGAVQQMVDKGLNPKPKLLALQRQAADIEGLRGVNLSRVAEARQQQGEAQLRIIDLRAQMLADSVTKRRDEQARVNDLNEKIRAAESTLRRIDITAPVSGQVVGLKVFTVGGVVAPRDGIMDIVPRDDVLSVDAQVSVTDIDVVQPGLPVTLKFTALNQRTTPTVDGIVSKVSADRTIDQKTGASFYTVRIALGGIDQLPKTIALQPGMPVEAMIRTGSRTFLEYLVKPITDFAGRGLHEG
jgi:HlyD family type I secretion membrane fusion protein